MIEIDASISAKTSPTDCEIMPIRDAVVERVGVVVAFAPATIATVESI